LARLGPANFHHPGPMNLFSGHHGHRQAFGFQALGEIPALGRVCLS